MSLDSAIEHLLTAKRISGTKASYAKDNPIEYRAVKEYLDGGTRPIGVITEMGIGLLEVEDERRNIPSPPPPPPPPPPGSVIVGPADLAQVHASKPAGSVVALRGGFGNQVFTLNKKITFVAETPGAASLGDVEAKCGSGSIELSGLKAGVVTVGKVSVGPGGVFPPSASDIVLRNLDATRFWFAWSERGRIYGGDYGLPTTQQSENRAAPTNPYDSIHVPTDLLIDGAYIHDFGMLAPGTHADGLQTWGFNGMVIRNSTFERCGGTGAITLQWVFEPETPYQWALNLIPPASHLKVYNNVSLDQPGEFPVGHTYHSYYDLQGEVGLPGVDYSAIRTQNNFPRGSNGGVYVYGRNGAPATDNGPNQRSYPMPNPPPPPNWPPV